MKKVILIFAMLIAVVAIQAQTVDLTTGPNKGTFWSSADTILQSETVTYLFRIKSETVMDMEFQLKTTKVSGTVTQNIFFQGSNDGVTFTNLDTIANSNASTNTQFTKINDFNYSYLKVTFTNSATAQAAWFQCWYSFRNE